MLAKLKELPTVVHKIPLIDEFKSFIARGNAIDLAVGVIIGAAFGKVTNSLVTDVIMPPIGLAIGNAPFKSLEWVLKPARQISENGGPVTTIPAVTIAYGQFIQTVVDFLIISLCIFMIVRLLNALHHEEKQKEAETPPPVEPEDVKLLREIRDELRKQAGPVS